MNGIDARREDARERLSRAFADGGIDAGEYEDRIERVGSAESSAEIDQYTADLPALGAQARPVAAAAPEQSVFTVLGSRSLGGNWLRERYATSVTLLGQTILDLRACVLPQEVTVHVVSVMGECQIIVPPGVAVINSVTPMLAEVADRVPPCGNPHTTIRLTGIAVMSEVSITPGNPHHKS